MTDAPTLAALRQALDAGSMAPMRWDEDDAIPHILTALTASGYSIVPTPQAEVGAELDRLVAALPYGTWFQLITPTAGELAEPEFEWAVNHYGVGAKYPFHKYGATPAAALRAAHDALTGGGE